MRNISQFAVLFIVWLNVSVSGYGFLFCLLLTISGFNQSATNSIHTFDYFILSFGNFAFCQLQYCWLDCCCFIARARPTVHLSICSRCWIVRATQLNRAAIIFTCSRRHFPAFSAWHDSQKFPYPYPYSYSCRHIYLYLSVCVCVRYVSVSVAVTVSAFVCIFKTRIRIHITDYKLQIRSMFVIPHLLFVYLFSSHTL